MRTRLCISLFSVVVASSAGCAGIKVINPNEPDNKGTLALDINDGNPRLVATYTCKLQSMGNRFYAVAKTEEDARKEAMAKCQSKTLLSFCDEKKIECTKN